MTDLLYSYTTTVKFLGSVLGPDYEVVLQDLSNINHSVIAIENGHISGRTIGSPLYSRCFLQKCMKRMTLLPTIKG